VIPLTFDDAPSPAHITQLSRHVELFSQGEPPAHALFVQAPAGPSNNSSQLLVIDPPADLTRRFRIEGDAAVLFTGSPMDTGLPLVQTVAGGVAHVRVGDHFLDVYAQRNGCIVHLPALGILCSGAYGSTAGLPALGPGSTGAEELDTLRLLARLVRERRVQLCIPQVGTLGNDPVEVMARLAADVAYLHGLRRVVPAVQQAGDPVDGQAALAALTESLLPPERRTPLARAVHANNLGTLRAAWQ
jgi:hypothetical protein